MTEKRTSSARARSGFTLAELLIVTGIVAILVAVSIPIMSGQVQKAKEVRAKAEARILCMALWMYLHDLDEQDIHPESWELMMELGGSFRDLGENPLENYLDGEISEDVSIYSVYYSDTLESYGGILCEIGGIEVEALISGKTEIVNPSKNREAGYCSQVGTFGTESAVRKRGGSRKFAVFKCEATANSVTGHVCVNSNRGRMSYKESLVKPCFFLYNETVKQSVWK